MNTSDNNLLDVHNLSQRFTFARRRGTIYAVENLSLGIARAEVLGLVGESGCGKSTTIRSIAQLHRPYRGEVYFDGVELCRLQGRDLTKARGNLQLVFQDPSQSLNPQLTVGKIIAEPLLIRRNAGVIRQTRQEIMQAVEEIMTAVGLSPKLTNRFPHEFSGGQKQRIAIARALVVRPKLILLDEPVSALDVSIQAQIVNLLEELQARFQLSYLFVAHDLAMVRYLCQRTAVMYAGHLIEEAASEELFSNPLHPYTKALLAAIPVPDPARARKKSLTAIKGEPVTPDKLLSFCPFASRCSFVHDRCRREKPPLQQVGEKKRVACWLHS